jgi:predicted RNase H-like HicB family nuclease
MAHLRYRIDIEYLPPHQGGGFLAVVPELPGCKAEGATREQAEVNARAAIDSWISLARDRGLEIPQPGVKYRLRLVV